MQPSAVEDPHDASLMWNSKSPSVEVPVDGADHISPAPRPHEVHGVGR